MPGLLNKWMARLHEPVYHSRIRELVRLILPHVQAGDSVLDVGCGFGALGRAIMDDPECPQGVVVRGLERVKRGSELIEVEAYDSDRFPQTDGSTDVVILADVLHHDESPDRLIAEAARVSRGLVIIKDHKLDGLFAQPRISLLDWAANRAYGVLCLYEYRSHGAWRASFARQGLSIEAEHTAIQLYPRPYRWMFTPRLQYLAVVSVQPPARETTPR